MRRVRLVHRLDYRFSEAARDCRVRVMLSPRPLPHQRVTFRQLLARADGAQVQEEHDRYHNGVSVVTAPGPLHRLELNVIHTLELHPPPASTGAPAADASAAPPPHWTDATALAGHEPVLRAYARACTAGAAAGLVAALALCRCIRRDVAHRLNPPERAPQTAATTLHAGRGSCEDRAHLAAACLRALGIPARYVSGYLLPGPSAAPTRHDRLHAWVSVHTEAGWRDVDPSLAVAAGAHHLTLAYGRDVRDVWPIRGAVQGGGTQQLDSQLSVSA